MVILVPNHKTFEADRKIDEEVYTQHITLWEGQ